MIEVNNLTFEKIKKKKAVEVIKEVLNKERKRKKISLVFLSSEEIKKINKKYRKKNQATDVLSFLYEDDFGEIAVCPEVIKKNAKKLKSSYNKELIRVLIHGVLHLLGYDHKGSREKAQIMNQKEKRYLSILEKKEII